MSEPNYHSSFIRNKIFYKGFRKTYEFTRDNTKRAFGDDIESVAIKQTMNEIS